MIETLQERARKLLADGTVAAVIGCTSGAMPGTVRPIVIDKPDDARRLVLDRSCSINLAAYLTRPEIRKLGRVAMVANEHAIKAAFVLMQEQQVAPGDVVIIGLSLPDDPAEDPRLLPELTHEEMLDHLRREMRPRDEAEIARGDELARMTPAERWQYWQDQFSRCIRCYACRQVCPMCYCARCIVEKNQPQWIETSPHERGNLSWNITRAFHLAGRCVLCGECERACPADIPLMKLNRMLAQEVYASFGKYIAGYAIDGKPIFAGYHPDDPNDFFE